MQRLHTAFALGSIALLAGACASGGIPPHVLSLARETKPGGSFFIEFGPDGSVLGADAEVAIEKIPPRLVDLANARYPGGEVVGAEKEYGAGKLVWEVVKKIDGRMWEILVTEDGQIIGGEEALDDDTWPAGVVDAARGAVGGEGKIVAVEKVWGPEAWGGEAYHVKIDKDGDSLRVGVSEAAQVIRVVRRIPGQVRVPR
jgi:hypothetical protein